LLQARDYLSGLTQRKVNWEKGDKRCGQGGNGRKSSSKHKQGAEKERKGVARFVVLYHNARKKQFHRDFVAGGIMKGGNSSGRNSLRKKR